GGGAGGVGGGGAAGGGAGGGEVGGGGRCGAGEREEGGRGGERGPARRAVLYTDMRAGAEAEEIRAALARGGQSWDALTGNLQEANSSAAMFRRLHHLEPGPVTRTRAIAFGPAGHLAHVLGAELRCDPTTAATTGLLDARTRTWAPAVARAAGIDMALLPRLTTGVGEVVGRTDESARELLGLPGGIPIVLAPGDAGAAT